MSKNIVLRIDGTWNAAAGFRGTGPTNVSVLHDRVIESASQTSDYLTGIGTEYDEQPDSGIPLSPFRRLLKRALLRLPAPARRRMAGGFGLDSKGRITRAYRILFLARRRFSGRSPMRKGGSARPFTSIAGRRRSVQENTKSKPIPFLHHKLMIV